MGNVSSNQVRVGGAYGMTTAAQGMPSASSFSSTRINTNPLGLLSGLVGSSTSVKASGNSDLIARLMQQLEEERKRAEEERLNNMRLLQQQQQQVMQLQADQQAMQQRSTNAQGFLSQFNQGGAVNAYMQNFNRQQGVRSYLL